jgi:hypothetical protein
LRARNLLKTVARAVLLSHRGSLSTLTRMELDGDTVLGNVIPLVDDGATHRVLVILG